MPQPYEVPPGFYAPITNSGKLDAEITSYAFVRFDPGRRVPPKPNLDQLDGEFLTDYYRSDQDE